MFPQTPPNAQSTSVPDIPEVLSGVDNDDSSVTTNALFYRETVYISIRSETHAIVKLSCRHAIIYGPIAVVLSGIVSLSHMQDHRYNEHHRDMSLTRGNYPI